MRLCSLLPSATRGPLLPAPWRLIPSRYITISHPSLPSPTNIMVISPHSQKISLLLHPNSHCCSRQFEHQWTIHTSGSLWVLWFWGFPVSNTEITGVNEGTPSVPVSMGFLSGREVLLLLFLSC